MRILFYLIHLFYSVTITFRLFSTACREDSGFHRCIWLCSICKVFYLVAASVPSHDDLCKWWLCLQPTGENGATRAPVCVELQRDASLSSKAVVLQIDGKSQQVSASEFSTPLSLSLCLILRVATRLFLRLRTEEIDLAIWVRSCVC